MNAAGECERTAGRVRVGDTARLPPHGVCFPTPIRQHCWYSKDSLGTVLSAPPTVPCSKQLAHCEAQNEVDKQTNGADSRDKVKHNERSDQLFLERMMRVAEQE